MLQKGRRVLDTQTKIQFTSEKGDYFNFLELGWYIYYKIQENNERQISVLSATQFMTNYCLIKLEIRIAVQ